MDNAHQSHTSGNLQVTKQALLNYVRVNKHMPCPDTGSDGEGDRTAGMCDSSTGRIPYNEIGLAKGIASDDFNNVFAYAVHKQSVNVASQANFATDSTLYPGSYFYSVNAPAFDFDTPPTVSVADSLTDSYQICSREAADNCGGTDSASAPTDDVETAYIPAVIIAYNENGDTTGLNNCTGSRGARESENCDLSTDTNPTFIKGFFDDTTFDDQIAVISAYEIKKYALGDLDDFTLYPDSDDPFWSGYDTIYLQNVDGTTQVNSPTPGQDSVEKWYIGATRDAQGNVVNEDSGGEDGDVYVGFNLGLGEDVLYVEGDIKADPSGDGPSSFNVDLGGGDDTFEIEGNIAQTVLLGDEDDQAVVWGNISGTLDAGKGTDKVYVYGSLTGTIDMTDNGNPASDNDHLYIITETTNTKDSSAVVNIEGTIEMGTKQDHFYLWGSNYSFGASASVDGGDSGDDYVFLDSSSSVAAWNAISDKFINFEYLCIGTTEYSISDTSVSSGVCELPNLVGRL
ncbi:hypothetical protein [Thiomicrorhabdus sediminis]|uniref:hypothetical protein n=1 Tax=Thiomicrorhabdus sediminis TaxID=2580412 RepID=UPI001EE8545A|nr:hypothetical protein [Thiomicrorhabdus sediminis]